MRKPEDPTRRSTGARSSFSADELRVDLRGLLGHVGAGELAVEELPSGSAPAIRERPIPQRLEDRGGQSLRVTAAVQRSGLHEPPGDPVPDDLAGPAHARPDDRPPGGHRLEDDEW